MWPLQLTEAVQPTLSPSEADPCQPPINNTTSQITELSSLAKPFIPQSTDRLPTLLVTNARSIWAKADDLKSYVTDSEVDVVCIAETWITPETKNTVLSQLNEDYHKISIERTKRKGSGTLIMTKKTNSPQIETIAAGDIAKPSWEADTPDEPENLDNLSEPDENKIRTKVELSIVKLYPRRLPRGYSACLIICVYIPEWVKTKQKTSMWQLGEMIKVAVTSSTNSNKSLIFVAGDLNGVAIGPFCNAYKLHQINKSPTRKERCQDVVLTNAPKWPNLSSGTKVYDHEVVFCHPPLSPTKKVSHHQ